MYMHLCVCVRACKCVQVNPNSGHWAGRFGCAFVVS